MAPKKETEEVMGRIPERCFGCHWATREDCGDGMYWFRCRKGLIPRPDCQTYREVKDDG